MRPRPGGCVAVWATITMDHDSSRRSWRVVHFSAAGFRKRTSSGVPQRERTVKGGGHRRHFQAVFSKVR